MAPNSYVSGLTLTVIVNMLANFVVLRLVNGTTGSVSEDVSKY